MSGPPQRAPTSGPGGQGSPGAFAPPLPALSSLSATIAQSTLEYESAQTPLERMAALKKLGGAASKLSQMTKPPQQQFMELAFRPYANVALRIALEMQLFDQLPPNGDPIPVSELAKKCNAQDDFLLRIGRVMGAFDILAESPPPKDSEDGLPSYGHTMISRMLTNSSVQSGAKHLFDNMLSAHVASAGEYWKQVGFRSPEDAKNTAFTFAHGEKDKSFFDILAEKPAQMALFNSAMAMIATIGLKDVITSYKFDQLLPNNDGIVLVDVGGGKGHVINTIKEVYPGMQGKMVLQDLNVVLDGGVVVSDEVQQMPYNFFEQEQPVKGSNYFLKSIFHDWPDNSCQQILRKLAPAMDPKSKLLVCELILPDQNADAGKVVRDMNMLLIGGKERSLKQWKALLEPEGYKIENVVGAESMNAGIIEAVYVGK